MTAIRKLLVANRGEIARRVFRTCREMGIATVAVYSDPDASAPFVREADEAVPLGGATPAESYLRGDAIVDAAVRAGADAVHPGYGFLAENAGFARACAAAGLTWVGPTPEAIEAMGSKIAARERLADAGVPVLPGEPVDGKGPADLAAAAEQVGWPLLAKASAGGGGKGMRIVREPDQLEAAVEAARREAAGAFGDDTLFLERYLDGPRHVEIQIFGDAHGTVVALHERDCSIQRRHQKIVEEAPSPGVDAGLRERMEAAAVAAGRSLGYVGAGTVEFLLSPEGDFFFLEVNTRLQVEHPVTELVTGLDLVRLQLLVAQGEPLPPEAIEPALFGHAIEVRLYAEDPANGFLPATGTLRNFVPRALSGVRWDTGVESGSAISVHYDPLLAKVIAHGTSRQEAASRLAAALAATELHGLTTNRDFLVRLLRHPEFIAGDTDTHFLERHDPALLAAPLPGPAGTRLHAAAAALAAQAERRATAPALGTLPSGWRNNPSGRQEVVFEPLSEDGEPVVVGYGFLRGRLGELVVDGEPIEDAVLHGCEPGLVDLEANGVRRRYRVARAGDLHDVDSPLGHTELRERPRHPLPASERAAGSLISPMPGTVVRVGAAAGDHVERGVPLVVVEAMKMEHEIVAPATGTVSEVMVQQGEQVEAGAVLAVIDEEGGES